MRAVTARAVFRRLRSLTRTVAVVGPVLAGALLGAACSSGRGSSSPTTAPSATATTTVATVAAPSTTRLTAMTVGTSARPPGPYVDITLLRTNAYGVQHVDLRVSVKGMVPRLISDTDGQPVAGTQQNLYTRIDYGDQSPVEGSDGGGVSCRSGAPLVPIDMTFNWSHDYSSSGAHTVTFKVAVCQLGVVTKTTTVTS